jgi:ribose transport system ATP-binding protein
MLTRPLLAVSGVCKQFPGVKALENVSLALSAGEVLAVVGENGAGKSTLMKILAGLYRPDAGEIYLSGQRVTFAGPAEAMQAGISLIHQELNLAENLSVADNLFLGREPCFAGPLRLINRRAIQTRGAALLAQVGLNSSLLPRPVHRLSPGQKQLVEIARALGQDAKILIMDEPTSSLTQTETDRLYEVIARLKSQQVSVLYISHRLAEVERCADRAVVLRDGRLAGELPREAIRHDQLVRLMVGRELQQFFPQAEHQQAGPAILRIENLRYAGGPASAVSFTVHAGEVLGMAGLVGSGRTELAEAVFGIRKRSSGDIRVAGKPVTVRNPREAIRAGIFLVPEDRRLHGLITAASVGFNLSLPNLTSLSRTFLRLVVPQRERSLHRLLIQRLSIKTPSARQAVRLLSGGNQQKIVFAKWLARGPRVLILDEPTRGVDVGAKAEIYRFIKELASQGVAIWMITSDMEELLGIADRVLVMHEGKLAGELSRAALSEVAVMTLATGGAST